MVDHILTLEKDRDIPDIPSINLTSREKRNTLGTVSYDVATLGQNNESNLSRKERVVSIIKHKGSQMTKYGQVLLVEIVHHCVTFPAPKHFDDITIATTGEECHRALSA